MGYATTEEIRASPFLAIGLRRLPVSAFIGNCSLILSSWLRGTTCSVAVLGDAFQKVALQVRPRRRLC